MQTAYLYQKGQILLIVILVMVVTLTVGLSVVSRTITNLRTTKEDETSQKAFSAAEAGVEQIINSSNTAITGSLTNDSSFSTTRISTASTFVPLNGANPIPKNDGADVWLSTYPTYASLFTGTVTVYWGQSNELCSDTSSNTQAALEIVVISGSVAAPVTTHYALDPCSARASVNNFTSTTPPGTVNGQTYPHSYQLSITSGLIMRVIPLYSSAVVVVNGSSSLPIQGEKIESTGTSGTTKRKIVVTKSYPKLPIELFPSLIFSL